MGTWPLTGRSEELAYIRAAISTAAGPGGIALAGAPGVGKTRLAREVVAAAARRGVTTRWVAASVSAGSVPLGAFAAAGFADSSDSPRMVGETVERLAAGSGRHPVIVAVDDAQLLDPLSAVVVQQLAFRRASTVIVTIRSGVAAPDAVRSLWKDGHLDRLEVLPLSQAETAVLLAAGLGGPVDALSARALWSFTKGNVLFLHRLVDGEARDGRLRCVDGVWRWTGEPLMSPGLTELIVSEMGATTEAVNDVVDLLALCEPLDVRVLAKLADPGAIEDGESLGLVSVEANGNYQRARLAHPLYGEARRASIGRLRARRLRGEVVVALGQLSDDSDTVLCRAVLSLESDLRPDSELLTAAARTASRLVDLCLAERLARAAIDAGGGFEPHVTLAHSLSFQNRAEEAEAELAALEARASDDMQRTLVAFPRAANLLWIHRRPHDAEQVLDCALAGVTDKFCRGALSGMQAALYSCVARTPAAIDLAVATLQSDHLSPPAIISATMALVPALALVGRADELPSVAERGQAEAAQSPELSYVRFALGYGHVTGLRLAGYIADAERVAQELAAMSADMAGKAYVCAHVLSGAAELAAGRVRSALRWLQAAFDALMPDDRQGFGFTCLLQMTEATALTGDATAARKLCEDLERDRHPAFAYLEPEILLAGAWVSAAEGTVRQATVQALHAADVAARLAHPGHEVVALHTAARFGDRTVAERLTRLAERVDGPRARAAATHATALAARDAAGLHLASVQLEEIGDLLAAGDAAAHAAMALANHETTKSIAASARAHRLAEQCEGALTPALAAFSRPLPLTEREREVVTLAASGLTSQQIAARLVVSVRTVEGHLYNASSKLGTTSRTDFARLLSGH